MSAMKRWLCMSFFSVCCLAIFPLMAWPVYAEGIIALNENNWLGADGAHYWHIWEPGTYVLEVDLSTTHNYAILIDCQKDEKVVLDGNLKTITGPGPPPLTVTKDGAEIYGVRVNYGIPSTGVEVRNLTVKNKHFGVIFEASSSGIIENVSATSNYHGICVWNGDNNIIRNNVASSNEHSGIVFDGFCKEECDNSNNRITGNEATNNKEFGLFLWLKCPNSIITDNIFSGNGNAGIAISGTSDQCNITRNEVNSNTNGLHITRVTDPFQQRAGKINEIDSNTANDNSNVGIWLDTSIENNVGGNQANRNLNGIWLTASTFNVISENTCEGNRGNGINLTAGSTDNTISQNGLNNNNNMGIALEDGSNHNTLNANTANSNPNGILLKQCQYNVIDQNAACNNTNVGIWLDSSADINTISNNTITGNKTAGIWLTSSSFNPITNNSCNGNVGHGLTITSGSNNNKLMENSANENGGVGIGLISSNGNEISGNTINNNQWLGIYLDTSNLQTIYNNNFINRGNALLAGTNTNNAWSISKTAGQNIVGGPFLGGNFWGKPDGTGFSQVTVDTDLDGLCDSAYEIAVANVDQLPLHQYVQTSELFVNPNDSTCGGNYPCFNSIQDALNAATSGNTIKLVQGSYNESYALNQDKDVTIQGEWDASFLKQTPGTTRILPPVAVTKGSLKFLNVKITGGS